MVRRKREGEKIPTNTTNLQMLLVLSKLARKVILVLNVKTLFVREGVRATWASLRANPFKILRVDVDFLQRRSELKTCWPVEDEPKQLVSANKLNCDDIKVDKEPLQNFWWIFLSSNNYINILRKWSYKNHGRFTRNCTLIILTQTCKGIRHILGTEVVPSPGLLNT